MPVQISKAATETSAQNVHFADPDAPWEYSVDQMRDSTYAAGGQSEANLAQFFSRPLKIQSFQWTPGSQIYEQFNPWQDYFSNPVVTAKLDTFKNLRCDLCIKVQLNGNPFYYGRALLSYVPYLLNDDVTVDRAWFNQDLVGASQRPHMLLDPCASQGGHMKLPFIWPLNWFDITTSGWQDVIGRCIIHDFDVLSHANGGNDPISINVFAWAENVELNVLTVTPAQSGELQTQLDEFGFPKPYTAQAKSKRYSNKDEFAHDGLISKPASAVAKAANALSMIPVLTPYAKATEMVASKVGQVAKVFGYSRPNNLSDISPYVPRYVGNLANCDAPETIQKLSVDSKNELSIDSRVVGLAGQDELTIHGIASRPSFLTSFDWAETKVSGDKLFSIAVNPCSFYRTVTLGVQKEFHPTALYFAAQPFSVWQGTIRFRFQVVCSEYHRGRLRIVYDPKTDSGSQLNATYSTIVDIAETRDFEYECAWTNAKAWIQCAQFDSGERFGTGTISVNPGFDNGVLRVECMNELATPSTTTANVKVLVWVSAGDDFAVAVPKSIRGLSYYPQQSEWYEAQSEDVMVDTATSNNPIESVPVENYGKAEIADDNQYLVYQGERIVSFRELLRRYNYHASYFMANDGQGIGTIGIRQYQIQDFPSYRGWDPNAAQYAVPSTTTPEPYNFCNGTLMNYLTPAFVCRRGAIRRKYVYNGKADTTMLVRRGDGDGVFATFYNAFTQGTSEFYGQEQALLSNSYFTDSGAACTPISVNPVLELEFPYYTPGNRYTSARDLQYVYGRDHNYHRLVVTTTDDMDVNQHRVDSYVAAAEDFNLSFFIGAPKFYVYNNPVATTPPPP